MKKDGIVIGAKRIITVTNETEIDLDPLTLEPLSNYDLPDAGNVDNYAENAADKDLKNETAEH